MLKRDTRRQADSRSPVANNIQIIGFYSGTEPDHRGRYVHEIQAWPDDQLEAIHDYIQWLFPLPERSGFNVAAPVLNPSPFSSSGHVLTSMRICGSPSSA